MVNQAYILIIEHDKNVREGLAALINSQSSMQVVGQLASSQEALETTFHCPPNIVLLDIKQQLEVLHTLRGLKKRLPESKFIFISPNYDVETLRASFYVGAAGFLSKPMVSQKLIQLIHQLV